MYAVIRGQHHLSSDDLPSLVNSSTPLASVRGRQHGVTRMGGQVDFFRERRLKPQLKLAGDREMSQLGDVLMRNLDSLFKGIEVTPCCLHGDLWSGNIATADGQPSVFDPAVYFGHSEAEFGMSWCAGFSGAFWSAYREIIPEAEGFGERAKLYRLYHYLNHYNLFGGGYRGSAMSELRSLTRNMK